MLRRWLLAVGLCAAPAWASAEELVLWHSYRAGEADALEANVAAFRATHPEHSVRVLAVPAGAYADKLRNAIPFGHGPDLFIAAHDMLGDLRRRDLIAPLADVPEEKFLRETLPPLRDGGRLWAVPIAFKSLALFYRTDLVDVPPASTDGLLALARRLRTPDRFGFAYNLGEPYFHAPWLHAFGGRVLSDDGEQATINSDAAVAAAEFLRGLVVADLVPEDVSGALITEMFNRGRAAMVINGPWFVSEIDPTVPYGIAPLPFVSPAGRPAMPFVTVEAVFIAKDRVRPAVLALRDALTSDAAAEVRGRRAGQPVANAEFYAGTMDPKLAVFRTQLAASVPMPTAPLMQIVWEPLAQALRQIARGALAPRAALDTCAQQIAVLARPLPPAAEPTPYLALLGLAFLVGLAYLLWRLRRGLGQELLASRTALGFVFPAAVGMLLFVGVPFAMGLGIGFFAIEPGVQRFVGLQNFVSILAASDYGPTHPLSLYFKLGITTLWTVVNVALHVGLGTLLALLLAQGWLRGRGLWRAILILPWAVPSYISALVFKGLFNTQLGAVNALLVRAGAEPVGWFDSFVPAFCANLLTNVWLGFPFMMVTVLGALQAIPQDLYEAARVDGAGPWRRFVSVTLPLLLPALVPAVVLGTIWTFNMFNVVFLVSEGQPEGATDILVTEAYRWAFTRGGRYGYAAAYSTIIFAILLLYSSWTKRLLSRR